MIGERRHLSARDDDGDDDVGHAGHGGGRDARNRKEKSAVFVRYSGARPIAPNPRVSMRAYLLVYDYPVSVVSCLVFSTVCTSERGVSNGL